MKKSKLLACLAMAGVLAIGAGTYALFSDTTDTKQNVFTIGSGLKGDIYEPNWKGPVEYAPSSSIAKDPQIKNMSTDESAYIAIKLEYKLPADAYLTYNNNNGTQFNDNQEVLKSLGYETEEAYIKSITSETVYNTSLDTFTVNTKNSLGSEVNGYWTKLLDGEGNEVANAYMYMDETSNPAKVPHNYLTEPIFKTIKIGDKLDIKDMLPFEIDATGYLVQTSNGVVANEALSDLVNGSLNK